ncbi:MAG: hypothetical protein EOP33_03295 [Rickettsiaceae bacterium]|nr:MAG: hypothetical protein EOP33_03295 [Rickettsiaceae bacterium]
MLFNLDFVIVVTFLALNLIVGLYYGSRVTTIKEYALGGRNFSTGALVSTIVATWLGGGFFFTTLSKTYSDGLYYLIASSCTTLSSFILAFIFIPKMTDFLGKTSVAEYMGDLYGRNVRIIVAIAGTIGAAGVIAVQFKAFGNIFEYFLKIDSYVAVIIAGVIVTVYSAFGGIRAVTFTDVLQFFTFGVALPLIGIIIWQHVNHPGFSFDKVLQDPKFDIRAVLNFGNPKFWEMIPLILYFAIPSLEPDICQRISIGKNLSQVKKAFIISGVLMVLLKLIMAWIPFLVYNVNPNIPAGKLLGYIIDNYTYSGFKGLIIIGVVALAMSTADSCINASSVLFSNDFCRPLNIGKNKELLLSRIFAFLLGAGGIFLALIGKDLLDIILTANSYYMPIVTTPLMVTILGFRTSTLSIMTGMIAGLITVIAWDILKIEVDCIIFATLVNLVFLLGSHYILKQPGGWNKHISKESGKNITDSNSFAKKFRQGMSDFSLTKFCKKNSPTNELSYTSFGIYCFFYTITTMYATDLRIFDNEKSVLVIYKVMMITSVVMSMYPIWPQKIKNENIVQVAWNIVIFYMLVFLSGYFILINKFDSLQLVVFTINLIVVAILSSWRVATFTIVIGLYLSTEFYKYSLRLDELNFDGHSPQAILIYTLLMVSAAIVIFLKPKEEQYQLSEKKVDHLSGRLGSQEKELREALELRAAFIRNVSHEYHAPMTGVVSLAESLLKTYKQLSIDKIGSYIDMIYKSAIRVESYDNNINMLSKLSKGDYQLDRKPVDLSRLLHDRIEVCRKLYEQNSDDREFIINVVYGVMASVDKEYFIQLFDNLIINAITYCKKGKIMITLTQDNKQITFTIADEGIGIPILELSNIFGEFIVSSKTRTAAGGRGVGLALCRKVVELHDAIISADSDGVKGAIFRTILFTRKML